MFAAYVFIALSSHLNTVVRHHYVRFVVFGIIFPDIIRTSVGTVGFSIGPIQSPNKILAFY